MKQYILTLSVLALAAPAISAATPKEKKLQKLVNNLQKENNKLRAKISKLEATK